MINPVSSLFYVIYTEYKIAYSVAMLTELNRQLLDLVLFLFVISLTLKMYQNFKFFNECFEGNRTPDQELSVKLPNH